MKKCIFMMSAIVLLMVSCSSQESEFDGKELEIVSTRGVALENVLNFEDYEEFYSVLDEIKSKLNFEEKLSLVKTKFPEFISFQEIYSMALAEMECCVDETEISYRNFMNKYSSFYYPLYQEDAGFYIPIKDEDKAFLTNGDCEVVIKGIKRSLKDIYSYNDLQMTGRAYYSLNEFDKNLSLSLAPTQFQINDAGVDPVGEEYDSGWIERDKRRAKLKARRRFVRVTISPTVHILRSLFHTEFCFRKKTIFGWTNSDSVSQINGTVKIPGTHDLILNSYESGLSSHDMDYEIPVFISTEGVWCYYNCPELTCQATVQYRGISVPLYYNWTMRGAYARTPSADQHVPIVPYL